MNSDPNMSGSMHYSQKKIIIIGAGVSGIACAGHLRDLGFENVKILEARDYVGGRTCTIYDEISTIDMKEPASNFIEMGAQWIHGQDGNAIYELAHSQGLVDEFAPSYIDALMNIKLNHTVEEVQSIFHFIHHMDKIMESNLLLEKNDISVSKYLCEEFDSYIRHKDIQVINILKPIFNWYCMLYCELNGCTELTSLSLTLLSQYKECEGSQTVELKYGFSSVVNLLCEKIPSETILLNKEVKEIDYTHFSDNASSSEFERTEDPKVSICSCFEEKNKKIKVVCTNGELYEADHVIVTIPLGYLKSHIDRLFVPELPIKKRKAVHSIGFGTVNKIFLEFSKPFWQPTAIYHVIWDTTLFDIFNEELQSVESAKEWMMSISRFAYSPGHPNMLCAWIVGEGAIKMESVSDDLIFLCCLALLQRIVGKKLPTLQKIIRSSWHSDPYSLGSYSYLSMNECTLNTNLYLAEPVFSDIYSTQHPVLQFAGEATHPHYYSTVHGAYESGLREAKRLFDHYRLNRTFRKKDLYENIKIAIIGAGIAGLSAGQSLFEKGFNQVHIFEAQERTGGRAFPLYLGDSVLELGAQWLHGTNNALHKFSVDHNLLCDSVDEPSYEGKGQFYTSNGNIIQRSVVQEMKMILAEAKQELEEGHYDSSFISKSVSSFFSNFYHKHIYKSIEDPIRKGLFDWFLKFEIIDNACDNLDQVSVQCYSEWCDIPDDVYHLNFKYGFGSVIKSIQSQIPTENIYLKKPVRSIIWQSKYAFPQYIDGFWGDRSPDTYPVTLECEDGEKISADIVILTASVGFIQENMNTLFNPALPEIKASAFSDVGFGTINKIFLVFEKPFWKPHDVGFQLVWTNNLAEDCEILLKENPWIKGITGFDIVRKQPNVLLGWIGGLEAKIIEEIDTQTISIVCTSLLKIFLSRSDIPYPVKTIRSLWYTNQYVKGAYSYRSLKFQKSNSTLQDLQSPLYSNYITDSMKTLEWPVVVFAGEAMNENSFSSVHGAYESGLKAANDIDHICSQLLELN